MRALLWFPIFATIAAAASPAVADEPSPTSTESTEAPVLPSEASPSTEPEVIPPPPVDHRQAMWRFELGYRGSFVSDAGYNPFSTNGTLPQLSLTASRTLFTSGRFSFAPGISWDYGGSGATARGDTTSLTSYRLTVPLEGRVHFGPWGYAFVRAAPGVALQKVEIDEPSAPAPFTTSQWLFATDLSAGYAWLLFSRGNPTAKVARLWLQADGGYGWVVSERLALAPALPAGDAQLVSGIDLGSLSMSGGFFRVGAAMSF